MDLAIAPIGPFEATIRPPGSKSLTNRGLLLAALAHGQSVLHQPLLADDTRQMLQALKTLGFGVDLDEKGDRVRVTGHGGHLPYGARRHILLNLGNAGTAYRFLTAACCLSAADGPTASAANSAESHCTLDGIARMRERPIRQLVEALRQMGGRIEYVKAQGFPPLRVIPGGLRGGDIQMPQALSSQYISALLMIGPCCREGLTIQFAGGVVSRPYVQMTLGLMAQFGVKAQVDRSWTGVRVEPGCYQRVDYLIEPDASSASYFLAAAAIIPGSRCTIEGLGRTSLQGDVGFADVLHQMGAGLIFGDDFITVMAPPGPERLRGVEIDLNHMPDMAQTAAAVAYFADGPTTIRNVGNLRIKETDRIEALRAQLTRLGALVQVQGDDIRITPPRNARSDSKPVTIETYNDHRMAMSFAVIGLAKRGVVIHDPACVGKTFPDFFDYLGRLQEPREPEVP